MQAADAGSIIGHGRQIVPLGTTFRGEPIELEIELRTTPKGIELSICGNVWQRNRKDIVQGGQMRDSILDQLAHPTVPRETVARIVEIWNAWHLNGMRAGTVAQESAITAWLASGVRYGYSAACIHLKKLNLYDDNGYKYGTAWLMEELPGEIIDEVTAFVAQYGKH